MHTGLAAGAALAALPVLLHLFMRQTPKRVVFPALRLIRERQKRSKKRLRVKNWLLLLARMLLLALMALALARPSIVSEASIGDAEVPTAIGLVFDTSLSMGYKQRDKTRLDEAKDRAYDLLKKTPAASLVYVVDSAEPGVPPGLSPSAARKRVEGLSLRAANRPLNVAVGQAYAALADADKPRHEVYVLTDLARTAWDADRPVENLDRLAKVKTGVKTYVLRLTPKEVRDVSVVEAGPPAGVVTQGEPVVILARLRSKGPATAGVAELWMDGKPREKKPVEFPADGEAEVKFLAQKVDPAVPVHQGEVRFTGAPDPVGFDDVRYFSFKPRPPVHVLVVSDLDEDGEYIADAVAPPALPAGTPRPYRVDRIRTGAFAARSEDLARKYRGVFLNNVARLGEAEWGRLYSFVRDGGGLVVGLGRLCAPEDYNGPAAGQLLPAALGAVQGPKEPTAFGQVADFTHPLFNRYPRDLNDLLTQVPVFRYWRVKPSEGSRVLISYPDKDPALVERVYKGARTGRVLLWTTPLARRPDPKSPDAWNEFPVGPTAFSFYLLMNQSVAYLSGAGGEGLAFEAGRDVILPIDPTRRSRNYVVQDPERKSSDKLSPSADADSLVVVAPQQLGNWSVKATLADGTAEAGGFSVNPPPAESNFTPLETADLDRLFGGKGKYALADDPESLRRAVGIARVGHELFPWLMMLILVLVSAEGVLANRFYRENPGEAAAVPTRATARGAA